MIDIDNFIQMQKSKNTKQENLTSCPKRLHFSEGTNALDLQIRRLRKEKQPCFYLPGEEKLMCDCSFGLEDVPDEGSVTSSFSKVSLSDSFVKLDKAHHKTSDNFLLPFNDIHQLTSDCPTCREHSFDTRYDSSISLFKKVQTEINQVKRFYKESTAFIIRQIGQKQAQLNRFISDKIQKVLYTIVKNTKSACQKEIETLRQKNSFMEKGINVLKKQNDLLKRRYDRQISQKERMTETIENLRKENSALYKTLNDTKSKIEKIESEKTSLIFQTKKEFFKSTCSSRPNAMVSGNFKNIENDVSPTNRIKRIKSLGDFQRFRNQNNAQQKINSLKEKIKAFKKMIP